MSGTTLPQRWQPLQDQQDDEDTDVCADPQFNQAGSSLQAGPVLQRSGESKFKWQVDVKAHLWNSISLSPPCCRYFTAPGSSDKSDT